MVREATTDTTVAARRVQAEGRRDTAAIASLRAAEAAGLVPLAEGIEDSTENYTRFLVLGQEPIVPPAGCPAKTSIVFSLDNVPGSLYGALALFADRGINLTKIENRPLRERRWEYLFYLDFATSPAHPAAQAALADLRARAPFFRLLGSYAQDTT